MASMPTDSVTGRREFTSADTLTRRYIVSQFAALGLKPVSANGGYVQRFPVIRGISLAPSSKVVVTSKGTPWVLRRKDDFVPREVSGNGAFSGGVAFIGYGINAPESGYDDFSKVDLKGKTVICLISPPRHVDMKLKKMAWKRPWMDKVALIDSLGGRAVIFVNAASHKNCNVLRDIDESKRIRGRTLKLLALPTANITHDALASITGAAGVDIATVERELETATSSKAFVLAGVEISMDIELTLDWADASNVVGMLPGRETARTIVIGAHYDGPSYDDNASGVSEVLELARLCSERGPFDCNLLFAAFGSEEPGLLGSEYFAEHIPPQAGAIKAMVNFDVIGRIRGDTLVVGNAQPLGEWDEIAMNLDRRGLVVESKPWMGGSDSAIFVNAGIPTFWFFEGFHGPSHVRDSLACMNWDGMERALRYSFDFVRGISSDEAKLGKPVPEKPRSPR